MDILNEALQLISEEYSVIPIRKGEKTPAVAWKPYSERRATEDEWKSWVKQWPDCNIAIITGAISGITVVDIEAEGIADLGRYANDKTTMVKTQGGGMHLYYKYEPGLKNSVRTRNFTDIRGDGGYVVAPPSIGPKGQYKWINKIDKKDLSPFPPDFAEELKAKDTREDGVNYHQSLMQDSISNFKTINDKLDALVKNYNGSSSGNRNADTTSYLGWVFSKLQTYEINQYGMDVAYKLNNRNNPPLGERELSTIYNSIKNTELRKRGGASSPSTFQLPPEKISNISQLDKTSEICYNNNSDENNEEDTIGQFWDVASKETVGSGPRVTAGLPILNETLDGGFELGDLAILTGLTGEGKCLAKGTEVLMYDGSIKKVEDIQMYDQIMGDDSTPRNVLGLGRGKEMMYEIRNKNNGDYLFTCNESHILSLKKYGNIKNMSVRDFLKLSPNQQLIHKGYFSDVIDFNTQEVALDPYILGLWLGDGTSNKPEISNIDREVIDYIYSFANNIEHQVIAREQKNTRCKIYNITRPKKYRASGYIRKGRTGMGYGGIKSFSNILQDLHLYKNKHIPNVYKINSRDIRLKVLAGLIDSDGHVSHNCIEIITKFQKLKDDIVFLSRSLGFACRITTKNVKGYEKNSYYRIKIYGYGLEEIPTLIPRKKLYPRKQIKDARVFAIDVKPIGIGEYYGFELDGNHLYNLANFCITHNTSMGQSFMYYWAKDDVPTLVFSYEVYANALKKKFEEMGLKKDTKIYAPYRQESGVSWIDKMIQIAKDKYDIKVVVIDNLDFLTPPDDPNMFRKNSTEEKDIRTIIYSLKDIAKKYGVVVLLQVHLTKVSHGDVSTDNIKGSSTIKHAADEVLMIKRERSTEENEIYTDYSFLSLEKNRKNGKTWRRRIKMFNNVFYEADKGPNISQASFDITPTSVTIKNNNGYEEKIEFGKKVYSANEDTSALNTTYQKQEEVSMLDVLKENFADWLDDENDIKF